MQSVDFVNLLAKFCEALKFKIMLHNNQSGNFFYFIVFLWLTLFSFFFSLTELKSLESLSFKL